MNPPRERSAIVAAWLEEGPNELPESTRRAIAVDVRTTPQSRRSVWAPRWFPRLDRLTLAALAAVAVMALVIGGLVVRPFGWDGSNVGGGPPSEPPSPSPSLVPASASPSRPSATAGVIPPMPRTFVSERHGYTISYPADWTTSSPADPGPWSPPDWKDGSSTVDPFDYIEGSAGGPLFRAASALLPVALPDVDGWIDENLTFSSVPGCAPPREEWEAIDIDGAPGRLRDSCGEVEATVVSDGRVYMFTLFGSDQVTNGRQLFDALAATIDLRPEDAVLPSPSPESQTVGARFSREMPQARAR
jgi:hypothetical protein